MDEVDCMLIDALAQTFDAVETHSITIDASVERVYEALWTADLGASSIIKVLLALRAMPGLISNRCPPQPRRARITLRTLIDSGFGILAENPGREIVLGVTGTFWRPTDNLSPFHREDFDSPVPTGLARAVWNFSIHESGIDQTILSTETRVICGDDASRRKFRAYWFFVRPFSGLIRRIMLRNVGKAVNAGL
jgi:hypothetical protein